MTILGDDDRRAETLSKLPATSPERSAKPSERCSAAPATQEDTMRIVRATTDFLRSHLACA
jgi:hypothetical protein